MNRFALISSKVEEGAYAGATPTVRTTWLLFGIIPIFSSVQLIR